MASREGNVLEVPGQRVVESYIPTEILASTVGLRIKGRTIKKDQGVLAKGTALAREDATGKYVKCTDVATNERQTVTEGGSGLTSFTLTYAGQTTASIDDQATALQVKDALTALSNIGNGDVTVTGSVGGPYTVTFGGDLKDTDVAQMTATPTGGTGTVTVATATAGVAVGETSQRCLGFLLEPVDTTGRDHLGNIILAGTLKRAVLVAANSEGIVASAVLALNGHEDLSNPSDPNSYTITY